MPQNSFRNSCISGLFWYFSMAAFGLVWNSVTACIKRGSPRRLLKVSFFWTFSSKSSFTQSAKDYKAEKTNCKGRRVVIERLCHLFRVFHCCCLFVKRSRTKKHSLHSHTHTHLKAKAQAQEDLPKSSSAAFFLIVYTLFDLLTPRSSVSPAYTLYLYLAKILLWIPWLAALHPVSNQSPFPASWA